MTAAISTSLTGRRGLVVGIANRDLMSIEDVGALAAFLVSDGARRITGTVIPIDGGQHAIA